MNDNNSIYMLNALWFKPDGGHNKYKEYMKSVSPLLKKYGGRVRFNHERFNRYVIMAKPQRRAAK